jgi:hypothetical protein
VTERQEGYMTINDFADWFMKKIKKVDRYTMSIYIDKWYNDGSL